MSCEDIKKTLTNYKVIAIVGLSKEPEKPSFQVGLYLKAHGYKIIPVNPFADTILGEKCYKTLLDIPINVQRKIEVVDIFRRSEDIHPIVQQVIKLKKMYGSPHVVWMQSGIVNNEAAQEAKKAGLVVIMDECMKKNHRVLNKIPENDS